MVDSLGTIVRQADYLPYGEKCRNGTLISGENDYLYCGKEFQAPVFNIPWYDSQARFQTTDGMFVSLDPQCEKYYSLSPYAYCAGNPVRYVDRDGGDWRDVANGFSSAVRTNLSPASPSAPISPQISNASHYAIGHYLGNAATIVLGAHMIADGAAMIAGGAGAAAGGVVAAPATAGALVAVSAAGIGAAVAGTTMSATGAVMFMKGVKGAAEDVKTSVSSQKESSNARKSIRDDNQDIKIPQGYRKVNGHSHGEKIYTNGKFYISQDNTSHKGGTWKMARKREDLLSKQRRLGTYDENLKKIGD